MNDMMLVGLFVCGFLSDTYPLIGSYMLYKLLLLLLLSLTIKFIMASAAAPIAITTIGKTIREVCRKPPAHWVGDGFNVFPVFANKAFTNDLSPFLMFDYAQPKVFPPTTKRLGVGQHPHRGFETGN